MLDLLIKRRSIRKFKEQPVTQDIIDKIIVGALTSPSSKNRKPWDIVVVNNRELLDKLGATRSHASKPISNAPLAMVLLGNKETSEIWIEDASIISTVIQLTAQSLGLGSCWIQARGRINDNNENVEELIKEILNIPEKYNILCTIALGYPDEEKSSHDIEKLDLSKVHYNKF